MKFSYKTTNIIISESVVDIFSNYIQSESNDKESGGIIVGKLYDNLVEITDCSIPNKYDKRSRNKFIRAHKPAQCFINKCFLESERSKIYLGEWHTHPENSPTPSQTDIISFNNTIENNDLNSNIHFMIIVGRIDIYIATYYNKKFAQKNIFKIKL